MVVSGLEYASVRARIGQLYILSVYQQAELFFRNFLKEIGHTSGGKESTGWLEFVMDALGLKPTRAVDLNMIGPHLIYAFDYYNRCRNEFVHPTGREMATDCQKAAAELNKFGMNLTLKAPNLPSQMDFDDFVLFSRVTKALARRLTEVKAPKIEECARLIHQKTFVQKDLESGIASFRRSFYRVSNSSTRQLKMLQSHLETVEHVAQEQSLDVAKEILSLVRGNLA